MGEVKPESQDLCGQHTPANIYCYFFFPEKGGGTKCQARLKNNLHLFSQKRCQQLREESGTGTADPFPPAGPAWQAPNAFLRSSGAGASAPQPRCGQHWSGVKIYAKTTDFNILSEQVAIPRLRVTPGRYLQQVEDLLAEVQLEVGVL